MLMVYLVQCQKLRLNNLIYILINNQMKKNNLKIVGVIAFIVMFAFGISLVRAAPPITIPLGVAETFGILSSTFTRNIGVTVITGDLGYTTLSGGTTHTASGLTHVADSIYNNAGTDQGIALSSLNTQACTYTFPAGVVDLATDTTHGTLGVYTPGVYCNTLTSAASIGTAGITLDGTGTYIFRINGAFTTVNNSNVRLMNGASSCNVFWTPAEATTLGANTTFSGTVIDASGITIGHNTSWNGRALAFGGTVTADKDIINSACVTINPIVAIEVVEQAQVVRNTSSGSSITYGCKDPTATNYNYFSASKPSLCKYTYMPTLTPSVIIPTFPKTGFPSEVNNASWFSDVLSFIGNFFN
jgi:hypothetical protein